MHVHNFGEREANNHRRNEQISPSEVERIRLRYEELARIRLHYKELTREGVLRRRQEAEEMAGENTGEIKRQEEVVRRKARKMAKGARK